MSQKGRFKIKTSSSRQGPTIENQRNAQDKETVRKYSTPTSTSPPIMTNKAQTSKGITVTPAFVPLALVSQTDAGCGPGNKETIIASPRTDSEETTTIPATVAPKGTKEKKSRFTVKTVPKEVRKASYIN